MATAHITNRLRNSAKCPTGKDKIDYFDDKIKGFTLEVRKSGGRTFRYRHKIEGKIYVHKIGDAAVLTVEVARKEAARLRAEVELGNNPFKRKRIHNSTPTLQQFFDEYYLPYIQQRKKSWRVDRGIFENHLLPLWGGIKMSLITRQMISKAHIDLASQGYKPAFANKLVVFVRIAFNLALEWEVEGIEKNPAQNMKLLEENNLVKRYLSKEEATRLMTAVDHSKNRLLPYIIRFLVLTGARKSEALKAKWSEFDFDAGVWTIPVSKSGKARHIPITDSLRALLEGIPTRGGIYLFPSPRTRKPFNSIYQAWNNARIEAGLEDVRLHDLRHTFASTLVNSGRSLFEVQQLLGHSNINVTQRYAHLSQESLRSAADCAGELLT